MTNKSLSLILKNPGIEIHKQSDKTTQILKLTATSYTRIELNNFKEIKTEGNHHNENEIGINVSFVLKEKNNDNTDDYFWYNEQKAEVLIYCEESLFRTFLSNSNNIKSVEILMSNEADNESRRKKLTEEKYEITSWKLNVKL